jgi:hypothetical protein
MNMWYSDYTITFCDIICDVTWLAVQGTFLTLTRLRLVQTDNLTWKFKVQVDPNLNAALYHVCRPTWKWLSQCPCQVLSLSLAVCCSGSLKVGQARSESAALTGLLVRSESAAPTMWLHLVAGPWTATQLIIESQGHGQMQAHKNN